MTLRQMEYLLTVAEEGSFTRAAERLHVSQPALSQQIRALEREAGAELLERLPGGVKLTAAGRAFAQHALTAVRSERLAYRAVRDALGSVVGDLEIATVLSIASGLLPPSLSRWYKRFPGVSVRLLEFRHRRLLEEAVLGGAGDAAIGKSTQPPGSPRAVPGWRCFRPMRCTGTSKDSSSNLTRRSPRQLAVYARLPFGPTVTRYVDILRQTTTMIERPQHQ